MDEAVVLPMAPKQQLATTEIFAYNDSSPHEMAEGDLAVVDLSLEVLFPYIMGSFAIAEYLLMVVMVIVNTFILAAYAVGKLRGKNGSLRLSSSGRLVLNLAFADLMVGLGLMYFSIFKFWPEMAAELAKYQVPCVLRFAICFCTMFGSHCALLVVALDRYTAIVYTLHYKDYVTTRVSWCMILLGWVVPLAGSGSLFYVNQWHPDVPYCDEHHVVPMFLIAFAIPSNVFVLIAISAAHWRVHREVEAFTLRCNDPEFVASAASRRSQGCRKSALVLLRVTTTFIVCWTPLDVMLVMLVVVGPHPWVLVVFEATFLMSMTSFLLNPLVYAWKTEAIRRPLTSALLALRVPVPQPSRPRGQAGAAGGATKTAGVFAIARSSVLSVSHSSTSGSASTSSSAQTGQSSLASSS